MNLYVVRHGEVPSNLSDIVCKRTDEKLTPKGIEQAQYIGRKLEKINFDAVFSSPLLRATETAKYIVSNKRIVLDERLTERGLGSLVGSKWKDVDRNIWNSLDKEVTPAGAETLLSGLNRTKSFLDDIYEKYKGKNVLVITHNFVSKCIWALEENITDKNQLMNYIHQNGEIKYYLVRDK